MRIAARGAVIAGAQVPGDVEVQDGVLVRSGLPSSGDGWVIPGLVDLQVNGYAGEDFNVADHDGVRVALSALAQDGILAVQPTVITDTEDNVARQLAVLGDVAAGGDTPCRIVGVHAEGPFLSPHHRGVHRTELLRLPDRGIVERLMAAGPLRTITVAPELEGAQELITWAASRGIIVQAGHSGADAATTHAAFDAGARAVTHLFNGMITFRHRDPGIVGATLAREDVAVQLIADDIHLSPETSIAALRAAEHRTMLVTDASAAAGAGDGVVTAGGFELTVVDGVPRLPDGTLAGSTVTLLRQVTMLVERGWPIERAVNLASRAPAHFYGLIGRGELTLGGAADLVVLDRDLHIDRVLIGGRELAS